jgi:hypothetical protein
VNLHRGRLDIARRNIKHEPCRRVLRRRQEVDGLLLDVDAEEPLFTLISDEHLDHDVSRICLLVDKDLEELVHIEVVL